MAAQTVASIVDDFRKAYPGCTQGDAVTLLNYVVEDVLNTVPLTQSQRNYGVTEGIVQYDIDELIVKIQAAIYFTGPTSYSAVSQWGDDQLDVTLGYEWREWTEGTPQVIFTGGTLTQGQFGISPPPSNTTLNVVNATNATPIVITTDTAHNLSSGDSVNIADVGGNTAANNPLTPGSIFYADVVDTFNFSLYYDSDFTDPVIGNGGYTSGGTVLTDSSPRVTLWCTERVVYGYGDSLSAVPMDRTVIRLGMCFQYSQELDPAKTAMWEALYIKALANQDLISMKRAAKVLPQVQLINQRTNWRGPVIG